MDDASSTTPGSAGPAAGGLGGGVRASAAFRSMGVIGKLEELEVQAGSKRSSFTTSGVRISAPSFSGPSFNATGPGPPAGSGPGPPGGGGGGGNREAGGPARPPPGRSRRS